MKSPEHGSEGGQAEIDPQPGEGTAGGLTWESLGTEGRHRLLLSYIGHPEGDTTPALSVFPCLTFQHHYTSYISHVVNCSPS